MECKSLHVTVGCVGVTFQRDIRVYLVQCRVDLLLYSIRQASFIQVTRHCPELVINVHVDAEVYYCRLAQRDAILHLPIVLVRAGALQFAECLHAMDQYQYLVAITPHKVILQSIEVAPECCACGAPHKHEGP